MAEECGLKRLWTICIREICVTLCRGKKGVGPRTVRAGGQRCGYARALMQLWRALDRRERPDQAAVRLPLSPRLLLPGLQCVLLQVSSKDLQGAIAVVPAPTDGMQTAVHDVALLKVGGDGVHVTKRQLEGQVKVRGGERDASQLRLSSSAPNASKERAVFRRLHCACRLVQNPPLLAVQDLSLKAKLSIMATLLASLRRQPGDPSDLVRSGWSMGSRQLVQRSAVQCSVLALVAVWRCSANCGWLQLLLAHRHATHTCM